MLVLYIVHRYKVDANDQCHRIVHDNHVYSNEFHFEHDTSIAIVRIMSMKMYTDRTVLAWEFVKQLVNDDNAEELVLAAVVVVEVDEEED